jgi:hypothetical protein
MGEFSLFYQLVERPTVCVTGGWREPTVETGISHSTEKSLKNAVPTSRPVHAVLGGNSLMMHVLHFLIYFSR